MATEAGDTAAAAAPAPVTATPPPPPATTAAGAGDAGDGDATIAATTPAFLPEEVAACLAAVREAVPEAAHYSDGRLRRFCRARKLDADAAAAMVRADVAWRAEVGADRLLEEPFAFGRVFDCMTPHLSSRVRDRHGRPLYIERTGDVDMPRTLQLIDVDDVVRRHIWHMEIQERRCGAEGKLVRIMDMARLSLAPDSVSLPIFRTVLNIDANHYPERLDTLYIVNAPWLFKPLWAVISPWLDPLTRAKFRILGADFQTTLRDELGSACLPVEYGGDADAAVTVPTLVAPSTATCGLHEVTVAAGATAAVEVAVGAEAAAAGAEVLWSVKLAAHTIGLEVRWAAAATAGGANDGGSSSSGGGGGSGVAAAADAGAADAGVADATAVVLRAWEEVAPLTTSLRGGHAPATAGVLTVVLDNAKSRWRSKTVTVLVEEAFYRDRPPAAPEGDDTPPLPT